MPLISLLVEAAVLWLSHWLRQLGAFYIQWRHMEKKGVFIYILSPRGARSRIQCSRWPLPVSHFKKDPHIENKRAQEKASHKTASTGSPRHSIYMKISFCCFRAIVVPSEISKPNATFQPAAAEPQLVSQHLLRTGEAGGCNCPNVKYLFRDICIRYFQWDNKPSSKQTKQFAPASQATVQQIANMTDEAYGSHI